MPEDILQHDDGVIHDHADQQQQSEQGHGVEGVAGKVHDRDRAQQRYGDCCRDDQRRAQVDQKEPDDESRQARSQKDVLLESRDNVLNQIRFVVGDPDPHAGWQRGLDVLAQPPSHVIDDRDGIRLLHLDDTEPHGRLAVEARQLAEVRERVLDFGDVAQADGRTLGVGDDEIPQCARIVVLQIELDELLGAATDQEPTREAQVLAGEGSQDVVDGDAELRHAFRQQVDANSPLALPADTYLSDTVDGLNALLDHVAGVLVELLQRAVAGQRQPEHRQRTELDLGHDRRIGFVRQVRQHLVHLRLDLVKRDVDVLFQVEAHQDDGHAGGRCRLDMLDAGDGVDRGFDDVSDAGV